MSRRYELCYRCGTWHNVTKYRNPDLVYICETCVAKDAVHISKPRREEDYQAAVKLLDGQTFCYEVAI